MTRCPRIPASASTACGSGSSLTGAAAGMGRSESALAAIACSVTSITSRSALRAHTGNRGSPPTDALGAEVAMSNIEAIPSNPHDVLVDIQSCYACAPLPTFVNITLTNCHDEIMRLRRELAAETKSLEFHAEQMC